MTEINTKTIFRILLNFVESHKKDYRILAKKNTKAKFQFVHFNVNATVSLEKDVVRVKTESIFNVPVDHPASHAIERELRNRDFYTRILPAEGLVLSLEFSIAKDGDVIANGKELGPYFEELIPEMKRMIDAIWLITIEKFPYLAGQQAIRVGGETIIVSEDPSRKTIQSIFSTVISKPSNHQFKSIFHEWILGTTESHDDDRLLPNFFFDREKLLFFSPKAKLIEKKDNISKYETIGTEKTDSTPFFEFIGNLSERIRKLPIKENSLCRTILLNIKRILDDKPLIATPNGEAILIALNSDIRDRYHYAVEHGEISAIIEEDVKEIAKWRNLIGDAILFGKYEERVMKARFAARALGKAPRTLEAEKRKVNRAGGGFSVYISPSEAQICNLGKEVSVELVEEGNAKYLAIKRLLE